jgi:hypothetical protein
MRSSLPGAAFIFDTLLPHTQESYSRGLKIKSTDPKHNVDTITVDEVYQKVCEQVDSS